MFSHVRQDRAGPADTPANQRFKQRFSRVFWGSLVLSLLVHVFAFWYTPPLSVAVDRTPPDDVELEPPPESRQAGAPVAPRFPTGLGSIRMAGMQEIPQPLPPLPDYDATPPPVTFEELAAAPTFTPFEVAPTLKNREQTVANLNRLYPESRRGVGAPVSVQLWFFIDQRGTVRRTLVRESSGFEDVDRAALRAAELMEFTPAWSRGRLVPVWIALPILFDLNAMAGPEADTAVAVPSGHRHGPSPDAPHPDGYAGGT